MIEIGPLPTLVGGAAGDDARVCVVVLHGHGMRPSDLAPFADSLGVPALFLFPQAPLAVAEGGYGWWNAVKRDAQSEAEGGGHDLADYHPDGREAARSLLKAFLEGIGPWRRSLPLVLAGFSQGGMLACDLVLHEELDIEALVLLSSSRIAFEEWRTRLSNVEGLHVLVSHGRKDNDLSFAAGEALRDALQQGGASVEWLAFDGGHELPLAVWRALRRLLRQVVNAVG